MTAIAPEETMITGRWTIDQGRVVEDQAYRRIRALVADYLINIGHDESGWDVLYRDPVDGRFWELTYPQGELHGGGPPQLRSLSAENAQRKYG